ncbi:MAG: hypothetical protein Q9182_004276 [Xanthomendoza sp. 2 TL-2023]
MHLFLLPPVAVSVLLTLLSIDMSDGGARVAATPLPDPQLHHHCLDQKHKFYQFCCETWLLLVCFVVLLSQQMADPVDVQSTSPDCDGIHGGGNQLKPGEHDKNWEEGPPPPDPEDSEDGVGDGASKGQQKAGA